MPAAGRIVQRHWGRLLSMPSQRECSVIQLAEAFAHMTGRGTSPIIVRKKPERLSCTPQRSTIQLLVYSVCSLPSRLFPITIYNI